MSQSLYRRKPDKQIRHSANRKVCQSRILQPSISDQESARNVGCVSRTRPTRRLNDEPTAASTNRFPEPMMSGSASPNVSPTSHPIALILFPFDWRRMMSQSVFEILPKLNQGAMVRPRAHQPRSQSGRGRSLRLPRCPCWYWPKAFALMFLLLCGGYDTIVQEGRLAPFEDWNRWRN